LQAREQNAAGLTIANASEIEHLVSLLRYTRAPISRKRSARAPGPERRDAYLAYPRRSVV
jgi:hypothetical protein